MVLWVIGLSGSGKTTLSEIVYNKLKPTIPNLVLLDGDVIRTLFRNDVDHTVAGRRKNAERISHLSKFLSDQGVHVIAAVLSLFPDWQQWNRDHIDWNGICCSHWHGWLQHHPTCVRRYASKRFRPPTGMEPPGSWDQALHMHHQILNP